MSLPVCPNCRSTSITWGIDKVPNGSNGCLTCGHVAPVRDFHPDPFATPSIPFEVSRRMGGLANLIDKVERTQTHKPRRVHHEPHVTQAPKVRQWWQE